MISCIENSLFLYRKFPQYLSRACPLLQTCDIVIQYVTYSSHTRYTKESVGNASLGGRLATSSSHTVLRAFWSFYRYRYRTSQGSGSLPDRGSVITRGAVRIGR